MTLYLYKYDLFQVYKTFCSLTLLHQILLYSDKLNKKYLNVSLQNPDITPVFTSSVVLLCKIYTPVTECYISFCLLLLLNFKPHITPIISWHLVHKSSLTSCWVSTKNLYGWKVMYIFGQFFKSNLRITTWFVTAHGVNGAAFEIQLVFVVIICFYIFRAFHWILMEVFLLVSEKALW